MISNQEILNRFDVLYNNIMSNQAPGLDDYEKSVFWNKAQLEVLKNHLNPKGNKYGEGFDHSSKRQIDFSSLIKTSTIDLPIDNRASGHYPGFYRYAQDNAELQELFYRKFPKDILCVINESVDTITASEFEQVCIEAKDFLADQFTGQGGISVITDYIDWLLNLNDVSQSVRDALAEQIYAMINDLLQGEVTSVSAFIYITPPASDVMKELNISADRKVVVPITNIELDTLLSRPYKYPPKSQAWRMTIDNIPEIMSQPNSVPVCYHIRYVKTPKEVNLASNISPEIPEVLIDEVLQRAVELAKNSWEGNLETTKALGERSE